MDDLSSIDTAIPPGRRDSMLPTEMDLFKDEIISSLRQELHVTMSNILAGTPRAQVHIQGHCHGQGQDVIGDYSRDNCSPSPQSTVISVPLKSSDLYHTHLYTEL